MSRLIKHTSYFLHNHLRKLGLLLLLLILGGLQNSAHAQTIKDQVDRGTLCYVYKLNNAQLKYIFEKDGIKDTTWFFTQKVDSFHYNKFDQTKLRDGCYLKTQVIGHKLNIQFIANYPFEIRTKSIKNNSLVFLFDNKTKEDISTATVSTNDRPSAYDKGFGGYVLNIAEKDMKENNKYIRVNYKDVDYYFYLNPTSNYISTPSKNRGVESSISPGCFIVSQPKYRHYDTVKYKAYLINPHNGKPLRKKAFLKFSGDSKTFWTKKIKRKTLGAYYGDFVLPDSLKIDKDYQLQITYYKRGRSFYNTEKFRLEDYQLDKNNYQLIVPKDTFNAGEDMVIYAIATDANGFALGDMRLTMNMSVEGVFKTYQDTIKFKYNERPNWYSLDTIMDEFEPTKITIPKNRLLNGLVKYKIVIDMIDVRQEKKQIVRYIYWDAQTDKTIFAQQGDTIIGRQLYLLKDTAKLFDLLIYQNSMLTDSIRIRTPFKKQVKYNYTQAVLREVETDKQQVVTIKQNLLNLIELRTKRTHDSVVIKMNYAMQIPLHYKIYKGDKEVASGTTNTLNYAVSDHSKDDYFLLVSSNLNGQLENNFHLYKISQDEKKLRLTANFPKEIYPGASVPLEISVQDYKGQAKENINLTTYAISSMFKDAIREPNIVSPITRIPQLEEISIQKSLSEHAVRALSLNQNYTLTSWMVKEFNLYKNDFYKIYYPLQNTYLHYLPMPDRTKSIDLINDNKTVTEKAPTQFALLPILGQRIVRPSIVRINNELVYNASAHINLPYSFACKGGTYTIEFRFQDHLIRIKDVVLKPNQKTLLCVSMDSILENNNRNFIVADSLPTFAMTTQEFAELDKHALFVSGLYFDTLKVYPLNDEKNVLYYFGGRNLGYINVRDENFKIIALPPHTPNQKKFVLEYNDKTQILDNEDYTCSFLYDDKVTNKGFDTASAPLFPGENSEVKYSQLTDHFNTLYPPVIENAEVKKVDAAYFEPNKTSEPKFVSPVGNYKTNDARSDYMQFDIINTSAPNLVGFWLINNEDSKKSSYFYTTARGRQTQIHQGGEGLYDIYLLFDNKEYFVYKNHKLQPYDMWFINTEYLKTQPIEKESLLEPILMYNRLTQKPMEPFINYPDESIMTSKIINSTNANIPQIKGILQNVNGQKIAYKEIYLERDGRFVQGATTNNKGEFEFLSVPKGNYMLKIFGDNFQPRYAYNVLIDKYAVYTFSIEMKEKNHLRPDLQVNENEVRLLIFQSKENTSINSFANVYDFDTRAPMSAVAVSYISKSGTVLAKYKSNSTGAFEIYTQEILDKSIDIKYEFVGYRDIILRDVVFLKTNANQLSVFMRTISNESNLPLIINMGLEEKTVVIQAEKPKESAYKKIEETKNGYPSGWGGIDGKIINDKGETVPFASIGAFEGGVLKGQTKTDINGHYTIMGIQAGEYSILVSSVGYEKTEIQGVKIKADKLYTQNFTMSRKANLIKTVMIKSGPSIVRTDKTGAQVISEENISRMYNTSSIDAIGSASGVNRSYTSASPINFSSDKDEGKIYLVDGLVTSSRFETASLYSEKENRKINLYSAAKAKSLRTNFSNLGYWVPNLVTNKKGKAYATLNFPDDVTMWKSYIVAMGRDYYNAVESYDIKSYKPVMVNSIVPRFLYQSDKLIAKAKFVNFDAEKHNIQIKISLNNEEKLNKSINLDRQYIDSIVLTSNNTDSLRWKAELDLDTYYKDGEEIKIPVFRDGLETTDYELHLLDKDTTQSFALGDNTKTTIYFNNTVLENILLEINKLKDYPYDCNEQKASKVKALLLEQKIRTQLKQKFEHKRMVNKLITELASAQRNDGSWGWWSNGGNNVRMTIYIAEVLNEANSDGFTTNLPLLAKEYIRENIKNFSASDKLYGLYLLKKMNTTNIDYDKLTAGIDYYDLKACDKLYFISNEFAYKKELSKSKVYDCLSQLNAETHGRYADNFFYDPSANMALAIKLLHETSMKDNVSQSIGKLINSGQFISNANTFSKAYLIEAWLKSMDDKPNAVLASVRINDSITVDKYPFVFTTTASKVNITHSGAPVWSSMVQDVYLPDPPKKDSLFNVRTQFLVDNKAVEKLVKGQDATLNIKVMSYRTSKNIMLEVPIPSACTYKAKALPSGNISHIEYYKHKVIYYIENLQPGDLNLSIPLRVNFGGEFTVPPAQLSLMYYPFKSGNNTKGRIEVN